MSYRLACPICREPEAVVYRVLTTYESDTNAGGHLELDEMECACPIESLTADQIDALDAQAAKAPSWAYEPPDDDW